MGKIEVTGARVNNLKNINVTIPHNQLTVITGLSGSGKSSLAFDTIFAEGQRRYIETFSSYARGMLGNMERPDVDFISGLSPVISIEQKTTNRNPRSTIGTITEIYDYLRLLYARIGIPHSYISGLPMQRHTRDEIVELIKRDYQGRKIALLAPVVKNRKGHYKELFESLRKRGYLHVRIDGEITELTYGLMTDRYRNHSIELVVDRFNVAKVDQKRLEDSVTTTLRQGEKQMIVLDMESNELRHLSLLTMDAENGLSYPEPAPHSFSFNSPQGACPKCKGLGYRTIIDADKIIPDRSKSIAQGAIVPLGKPTESLIFKQIEAICKHHGVTLKTPVRDFPEAAIEDILHGANYRLRIDSATLALRYNSETYDGIVRYIESLSRDEELSKASSKWVAQFFSRAECEECHGDRLNKIALHYFVHGTNIAALNRMEMSKLLEWIKALPQHLTKRENAIGGEILKEISTRLQFLIDVGLGYLTLARSASSLSGGESQRIRLATQIGSELINVLYILDEPSIGLHPRDNERLITSLKQLRDAGNTVIVVEHDEEVMRNADYIVDIGPGAGRHGGEVVFEGNLQQMLGSTTLTAQYLTGGRCAYSLAAPTKEKNPREIALYGAKGHNLKGVDLHLPLGKLVTVTGVSGSGKSSLINQTLYPIISRKLYSSKQEPLPYDRIEGLENIDKIVVVDQSPIGRTPRSNPATFTGLFTDIRNFFGTLPDAKLRGYTPGRFSFNVSGGRCETCKGNGYRTIEMNFLPDVLVPCEECHGKRYNRETLEVRFKGKSISDVLEMTVEEASEFFSSFPNIKRKIDTLLHIGLPYIKLGQPSSTLSGGENQRVKLAAELAKRDTGKTLYILDEPTTGLHFEDVAGLLKNLRSLVAKGNTVVVIEHNMDVILSSDHIIDLGPEGGDAGGEILAQGTPREIAKAKTFTGQAIAMAL